jgi:hypothetical protein
MSHRDTAKRLLKHYLSMIFSATGNSFDSDNYAEIDDIVDHLLEAVKDELRLEKERQEDFSHSYNEYKNIYNKERGY